jgi:hypothetical protein
VISVAGGSASVLLLTSASWLIKPRDVNIAAPVVVAALVIVAAPVIVAALVSGNDAVAVINARERARNLRQWRPISLGRSAPARL